MLLASITTSPSPCSVTETAYQEGMNEETVSPSLQPAPTYKAAVLQVQYTKNTGSQLFTHNQGKGSSSEGAR